MIAIKDPHISIDKASLKGHNIEVSKRYLKDIITIFENSSGLSTNELEAVAYEVECFFPVEEGTEGGLFYGFTRLFPGQVNGEYFMTKGHFQQIRDRAEFYWGIEGEGALLFMN
jgi:glucose-6-phosphate isomerase